MPAQQQMLPPQQQMLPPQHMTPYGNLASAYMQQRQPVPNQNFSVPIGQPVTNEKCVALPSGTFSGDQFKVWAAGRDSGGPTPIVSMRGNKLAGGFLTYSVDLLKMVQCFLNNRDECLDELVYRGRIKRSDFPEPFQNQWDANTKTMTKKNDDEYARSRDQTRIEKDGPFRRDSFYDYYSRNNNNHPGGSAECRDTCNEGRRYARNERLNPGMIYDYDQSRWLDEHEMPRLSRHQMPRDKSVLCKYDLHEDNIRRQARERRRDRESYYEERDRTDRDRTDRDRDRDRNDRDRHHRYDRDDYYERERNERRESDRYENERKERYKEELAKKGYTALTKQATFQPAAAEKFRNEQAKREQQEAAETKAAIEASKHEERKKKEEKEAKKKAKTLARIQLAKDV